MLGEFRRLLLKVVSKLILFHQGGGESSIIGAIRSHQRNPNAILSKLPIMPLEAFLKTLPTLIVGQPNYQSVEDQAGLDLPRFRGVLSVWDQAI